MTDFATRLIAWQNQYGRHDLPWQNTTDPYAIWVSEIMLQQTQVSAVIAYYQRFMQRFPDIATLAQATQDEVLNYWSGLGYYSRARNLHLAAQTIMNEHNGIFPNNREAIQTLAGIGRSTAAAIAAFAFNQVEAILDGNVKRVLTRHFAIAGWPGVPSIEKALWRVAESLLPDENMIAYTQGIMDLGATVCTRSKPKCPLCPLQDSCLAYQHNCVNNLPTPKPKRTIPIRKVTMLILLDGDQVMLEKRPASGIWGGLWSFPEIENHIDYVAYSQQQYDKTVKIHQPLPEFIHTFTHFKLHITPQPLQVTGHDSNAQKQGLIWLKIEHAINAAIPAPIRKILDQLLAAQPESHQ